MDRIERAELVVDLLKGLNTFITEDELNEMADLYLLEDKSISIEPIKDIEIPCSRELDEEWHRESI